jgi:hypothetical protein
MFQLIRVWGRCCCTYTVWVDQGTVTVELAFFEVSFVDDAVRELEAALAFLPVVVFWTFVF